MVVVRALFFVVWFLFLFRAFSFLSFFSPFFLIEKKEKKRAAHTKKSASSFFIHSFIHSFIHRNASWRRASRAYTRSFERTPEASSGCNKARVFDVKKMRFFCCLSLSLSRAKKKKKKTDGIFSFSRNRTSSECRGEENVYATSDGKRDGVRGVEIFRGRCERV